MIDEIIGLLVTGFLCFLCWGVIPEYIYRIIKGVKKNGRKIKRNNQSLWIK